MGCSFSKDDYEGSYAVVDAYTGERNLLGMRHGYGTLVYGNGDRYQGTWRWNHRHGYGDYYYTNGDRISGFWLKDEFIGNAVVPPKDYGSKPLDAEGRITTFETAQRRDGVEVRKEQAMAKQKRREERKKREQDLRAKYGLT